MGGSARTMRKGYGLATVAVGTDFVVKFDHYSAGFAARQARYMMRLPRVCPHVHEIFGCGYVMERCWEPTTLDKEWAVDTIVQMAKLLDKYCWEQRGDDPEPHWANNLRGRFTGELPRFPWESWLGTMHVDIPDPEFGELIHGDCTLANVLYGSDGALRITDPLPPSEYIPPHATVDVGKLFQSAIGWENVAHGWPYYKSALVEPLLAGSPMNEMSGRRALFWLMIHLLRTRRYVSKDIYKWAYTRATLISKILDSDKEINLCDTLTILTEPSPTLARLSTRRTKRSASRHRKTSTISRGRRG